MRCGRKIGTRVPMRRNSMCGIARSRLRIFLELVVAENQRVATGKKHVAHFGVFFEITKRFLEIGVQFLFAHATDDAAARAISAVTGATIGHEKEHAVRIAMHQSRHRHVRIFAARIGHVVRRRPRFFDPRNDLTPDRAIRIIALDQIEKMRRDGERELRAGKQNAAAFFIRKFEMLLELGERSDPIFQLPFPIIPEFGRDIGPIARRMRDELFSIHFANGKSNHFS